MFLKFQGSGGDIIDCYIAQEPGKPKSTDHRTSPLAPGFVAGKNTVEADQESSLVQAVFFHERWTLDNQPRGSVQFRGSAGVLGQTIEMLQALGPHLVERIV